jgi:hypothetical protein
MLTPDQIEHNWNELQRYIPEHLKPIFSRYNHDVQVEDVQILGLMCAPAGKGVHHAYQGGLVEHILEMVYYLNSFDSLLDESDNRASLDHAAMIEGALLHDIHKGFMHFYVQKDGSFDYYKGAWNAFNTPNQKTIAMLMECDVIISPKVLHILNCSEGGWAENAPREATVEAKLVYVADELSVVNSRLKQGNTKSIRDQKPSWFDLSAF